MGIFNIKLRRAAPHQQGMWTADLSGLILASQHCAGTAVFDACIDVVMKVSFGHSQPRVCCPASGCACMDCASRQRGHASSGPYPPQAHIARPPPGWTEAAGPDSPLHMQHFPVTQLEGGCSATRPEHKRQACCVAACGGSPGPGEVRLACMCHAFAMAT